MQFGEILLQFKIAVVYFNTQHVQVPLWWKSNFNVVYMSMWCF